MNRIEAKFRDLKKSRRKALILYMTAGDPSIEKNASLILAFEKEGADLIELGVPFSDPLADGTVIQDASRRALKKKTDLKQILSLVRNVRKQSSIPILLMSYLNPLYRFGLKRFSRAARAAGVDGVVIPDLPPDEGRFIEKIMRDQRLDLVYLLAPTSGQKRRALIGRRSRGFVYYVSITGITGARRQIPPSLSRQVRLAKSSTRLPVCVGFGISTPEQAKSVAKVSDGVIIGSALVRALSHHPSLSAAEFARKVVRPFSRALGNRV